MQHVQLTNSKRAVTLVTRGNVTAEGQAPQTQVAASRTALVSEGLS